MAEEITKEGVRKRRFGKRDFAMLAESIGAELDRRREARKDTERVWGEIDRQIGMRPSVAHKLDNQGNPDPSKRWMTELELPGQAQTLEVLVADARRMLFPSSGPWFAPHAALTDEYLRRVDMQSLIAGDETEVPSIITQDNADKLVLGVVDMWHRFYDFRGNVDLINSEAFKYGTGIGRARKVRKDVFIPGKDGVRKVTRSFPALVPRSIKHVYLDDSQHNLANEGYVVEPLILDCRKHKLEDMRLAASRGSNDPEREDGGWMPAALAGLEGDKLGYVEVVEAEGDFLVPRKTTGSVFLPAMIITIARGKCGGKAEDRVIRMRARSFAYNSYIDFPYHRESPMTAYATSPLMKGWPVQAAAVEAVNRLMDAAALDVQPPIGYDANDMKLVANGGPQVYPGALWETLGDVKVHQIGNPQAMFAVYTGLLQQYADVTGVSAPRLGAQTVSHTTAYAKEAELSRGTVRTVDYVESTLKGPLARWLELAYSIGKPLVKDDTLWIEPYEAYVTLSSEHLPDQVVFDAHGAGGPAEAQAKSQARMASAQQAIQIDQIAKSYGQDTGLDLAALVKQTLREGGWTDVDALIRRESVAAGATGEPALGADAGAAALNPAAALQALAFSGQ